MSTQRLEHLDQTASAVPRIDRAEVDGEDREAGSAGPMVPSMDHKEQLHQRVDARLAELQAALAQLDVHLAQGERGRALAEAIATARSSMSGGWDRVGEVEAAHLAHWLSTTEDLRVTSPGRSTATLPAQHSPPSRRS